MDLSVFMRITAMNPLISMDTMSTIVIQWVFLEDSMLDIPVEVTSVRPSVFQDY